MVEVVAVPSSVLDAGFGTGAERTRGVGIMFFLPGFSVPFISGAEEKGIMGLQTFYTAN